MVLVQVSLHLIGDSGIWDYLTPIFIDFGNVTCVSKNLSCHHGSESS